MVLYEKQSNSANVLKRKTTVQCKDSINDPTSVIYNYKDLCNNRTIL